MKRIFQIVAGVWLGFYGLGLISGTLRFGLDPASRWFVFSVLMTAAVCLILAGAGVFRRIQAEKA